MIGIQKLADRGGAVSLAELRPVGAPDERVVGEGGRRFSAEESPEADLVGRRVDEVLAAGDQVNIVAQVVDDHAQRVGPVAVAVADRQVTGGRNGRERRAAKHVVPGLLAIAERYAERQPARHRRHQRAIDRQPSLTAAARAARA